MATKKYWKLTFEGEQPVHELQSAVGQAGGIIVRIHQEGSETRVYFATEEPVLVDIDKKQFEAVSPLEVSEEEVLRLD